MPAGACKDADWGSLVPTPNVSDTDAIVLTATERAPALGDCFHHQREAMSNAPEVPDSACHESFVIEAIA